MKQQKKPKTLPIDIRAPRSTLRAGHAVTLLIFAFFLGMAYLSYVLITESPMYMAKSGKSTYGIVYDRSGDILFDGSKPLSDYPDGQFRDIGNFIGDTSGQMTNTLVAKNITALANYSFSSGVSGLASIRTTLSHAANQEVFRALGKKNGAVIACNWKTGELLVCVSKPCVDIAEGYENIASMPSGSLLCKAFYPTVPGSTQKISTLIAAYETLGVKKTNKLEYDCTGSWLNANGQRINCHKSSGHGTQLLSDAFANSCNPYFAQLVQSSELPLSKIIEVYQRMGYSVNETKAQPYTLDGISIPAASTVLTSDSDFDTQWGCLGQGETLISPYQIMLWQTAVANGTGAAVLPYTITAKTAPSGKSQELAKTQRTPQLFSVSAARAVQEVMIENAKNNYQSTLSAYNCGVKSGTAQVNDNGREYENSLLAGFSLDENCPIAFCILIEERTAKDVSTAQIANVLLNTLSDQLS